MHPVAGVGGPGSHFEDKHSLDSDEKENDDEGSSKYDMLASEDVEGELYQELTFCWGNKQGLLGSWRTGGSCLLHA